MPSFISSGPVSWKNRLTHPAFWLATGFGSGLLQPAPGTWGSAVAAIAAWFFLSCEPSHPVVILMGLVLITFAVGIWASDTWESKTGQHDSGMIVIDEFAGMWICIVPLANDWHIVDYPWLWLLGGFLIFRLLDIAKPYPINWLDENIPGAMGVMVDDVVAGILSAVILFGIMCLFYI